jgi:predicted alpha/beta superfamily hydrolase
MDSIPYAGQALDVYLPPDAVGMGSDVDVLFVLGHMEWALPVMEKLEPDMGKGLRPCLLVSVPFADWANDFSPWPAPALPGDDTPFGGGADAWLHELTHGILPFVRHHFADYPLSEHNGLLGYSLSGLGAVYALYRCPEFSRIGAMSSSLWFEGFTDYMRGRQVANPSARVYLSLGKREAMTKHPVFRTVADKTRLAYDIIRGQVGEDNCALVWNEGGHSKNVDDRYLKALRFLLRE